MANSIMNENKRSSPIKQLINERSMLKNYADGKWNRRIINKVPTDSIGQI